MFPLISSLMTILAFEAFSPASHLRSGETSDSSFPIAVDRQGHLGHLGRQRQMMLGESMEKKITSGYTKCYYQVTTNKNVDIGSNLLENLFEYRQLNVGDSPIMDASYGVLQIWGLDLVWVHTIETLIITKKNTSFSVGKWSTNGVVRTDVPWQCLMTSSFQDTFLSIVQLIFVAFLQRLVPISAISRTATRGTSRDQERKRSRSKASVGSLACEDLARPKKVVVLRSWSIAIELEHQNSSRKPNSMNNRFCGVNMILNDFDIKILGSDSDTSWIRGYEFDMVWNMSLIYVFWHGFGCNIDVFLIWHRT